MDLPQLNKHIVCTSAYYLTFKPYNWTTQQSKTNSLLALL